MGDLFAGALPAAPADRGSSMIEAEIAFGDGLKGGPALLSGVSSGQRELPKVPAMQRFPAQQAGKSM